MYPLPYGLLSVKFTIFTDSRGYDCETSDQGQNGMGGAGIEPDRGGDEFG